MSCKNIGVKKLVLYVFMFLENFEKKIDGTIEYRQFII